MGTAWAALRACPATAKAKAKFILATDGQKLQVQELAVPRSVRENSGRYGQCRLLNVRCDLFPEVAPMRGDIMALRNSGGHSFPKGIGALALQYLGFIRILAERTDAAALKSRRRGST